jgi:hypothetical protein
MFRLFSRIRQQLLSQKKLSSYLLYAVGEITLVVIGILIALQINNWNEAKSLNNKVNSQLINLSLGLEANVRMLNFHKDANERRFFTWQHILKYAGRDSVALMVESWNEAKNEWEGPIPTDKNDDFINTGLLDISWAFLPPPWQDDAINEMKEIGLFSEIKNEQLKRDINRFYFLMELYFSTSDMDAYHLSQDLSSFFRNEKSISLFDKSKADEVLEVVANDEQVHAKMVDLTHYAHYHYGRMNSLIRGAEKLIADIGLETER